ncbi:hypothetical protein MTO96_014743 [Rhipicephalus appendiculatus]
MLAQLFEYPEDSSDLQKYQDVSRCYPDIGEWYMMYRNFYVDQTFGGSAKCVKYSGAGKYNDYSMPAVIEYHPNESVSYYEDPEFGGVQKCVLFQRYGIYSFENYSTSVEFLVGRKRESSIRGEFKMTSSECYTAKDKVKYRRYDNISTARNFHLIYTDCQTCSILRHHYAANGYGCSYWLRIDTGFQDNDGCEFIYDENCGTSPKYYFYDNSCPFYYDDPDFGGVQKCVKFRRYGIYSFENYSTSIEYVIGKQAEESIRGHLSMTSTECYAAKDLFNYYRYDSYGCSYWLRIDTGFQDNDGCEFIYDENCGTSPKYYFYDNTCPM